MSLAACLTPPLYPFLQLACVVGSVFLMVDKFLDQKSNPDAYKWNGIAVLVQNLLIFVGAWVMRLGNIPSDD